MSNHLGLSRSWFSRICRRLFKTGSSSTNQFAGAVPTVQPRALYLQDGQNIQFDSGSTTNEVFTVANKIGQGGYGSIYKVSSNGKDYALKIIDLWLQIPSEWDSLISRFDASFHVGQLPSHYIVSYYHQGMLKGNPCILMELCGEGDLEKRMTEFKNFNEFRPVILKVLSGLLELHNNGVIHRDIKPQNILFVKGNEPRLTDFDFSAFLKKRKRATKKKGKYVQEIWYTENFAPPEAMDAARAFERTRPPMDMFALGVTMYVILAEGKFPWGKLPENNQEKEAYELKRNNNQFTPIEQLVPRLPIEWAHAINLCLSANPDARVQSPAHFFEIINYDGSLIDVVEEVIVDESEKLDKWILSMKSGVLDTDREYDILDLIKGKSNKSLTLGRHDEGEVDIVINERPDLDNISYVSRTHATMKFQKGKWHIRDGISVNRKWTNSTNGTAIYNALEGTNTKVDNKKYYPLKSEDIVRLADTVYIKLKHI